MKVILSLLLIVLSFTTIAQTKLVITDTSKVEYSTEYATEGIDSIVSIKSEEYNVNYDFCGFYEVYFDKDLRQLAYKSEAIKDSCITYDYWRNGTLKKKVIYQKKIEGLEGIPVWWYDEIYCSNGQLIFKGPSNMQPGKKLCINYYCNGSKKLEFYLLGVGADGKMTKWYENGKIQSESYYDYDTPIGKWTYWSEDGQLEKTESYDNGKLTETKNYR